MKPKLPAQNKTLLFSLLGAVCLVVVLFAVLDTSLHSLHWMHAIGDLLAWLVFTGIFLLVGKLLFLRRITDVRSTAQYAEDRFRAAAEINRQAFCILEDVRSPLRAIADFQFSFANAAALKLLRLPQENLIGRKLTEVMPNIRESGVLDRLKEVLQTKTPYTGEIKDTTPEGVSLCATLHAVVMQDGLAITLQDLQEERSRQKHIEELNRFSQSIIQDAPFSIIATNPMGVITAVNMATEQLTGYRRHELVGKHSIVIMHDPAELSARAIQLTQSLAEPVVAGFDTLTASLKRRKNNESEWNYVRSDGRRVAVHLAMTVLRGPEDEITGYLAVAFDISERKKLNDSISFLAHHDALTKLPNRMLLNERMRQAIERAKTLDQQVAVFMVDIDHFKRINDSLGHWAGDQLLIDVSERLLTAVRKTDTVARVGGDEFIVLMPNSGTVEDAYTCASRILSKLQPPVTIAGREVSVSASVGFCIYPDWGGDPVSLLRNADAAMYAAKARGRNHFQAFSGTMLEASSDKLELEADLRHAVKNGQMYIAYQPQVDCRTGDLVGVEALLRWKHPSRGMVSPVEFIPIAEESGLILPIGQWALKQACIEAKKIQERAGRRLTLAANLSPRQFQQKNLSEIVEEALQEAGLSAEDLEIEITESTLMVTSADTMNGLSRLRERGVRIAIDDFGTGFSNFKYILDYKADRLKIDRSFVAKCPDDATASSVVRSVIAMAHGLNMKVVAEGVETADQLSFLLRKRCDEAQGFYLGKPMPLDELVKVAREWNSAEVLSKAGAAGYANLLAKPAHELMAGVKPM
ncbi:MAG TPA: EAL domain-containing protein [Acidobacteriaceae bacterium]